MSLPARLFVLFALACLQAACVSTPERSNGEFVARSVDVDGTTYRYQVFVPASSAGGKRPAAILFLHGSGERGSDNNKQLEVGLGPYVRGRMQDFPAIVVFPQAPDDSEWTQDAGRIAIAALDAAAQEFDADPARIYLTGISMGGYGTWELALQSPQRFAALVPVCGGITVDWTDQRPQMQAKSVIGAADPFAEVARRLRDVPVWIFHGAIDDTVPPAQSQRMNAALKAAGARDVRYTEFPGVNHFSWDPTYATPALWDWLFVQRR
jgi:predicted peptidase